MSTVIIRSKNKHTKGLFELSDEARQRGREHLKSLGYQVERFQPLIWPDDAVSAYQEHMYAPWRFTTKSDILQKKRERMEHHLWRKRESGITQRKALYVWVFWCPGVGGFAFRGWWIYLVGVGCDYRGGGYKGQVDGKLADDLLRLFPLTELNLFETNWDEWMKRFVKKHRRGRWCGKPQGKAPIWAEVQGSSVLRLLSRAEWPAESTRQKEKQARQI